jgi:hypothetical protein
LQQPKKKKKKKIQNNKKKKHEWRKEGLELLRLPQRTATRWNQQDIVGTTPEETREMRVLQRKNETSTVLELINSY